MEETYKNVESILDNERLLLEKNYDENNKNEISIEDTGNFNNTSTIQNTEQLDANTLKIEVKTLDGNKFDLYLPVDPATKISTVKLKIEDQKGYPTERQRLVYEQKLLEDHQTLNDYNIKADNVVYLALIEDQITPRLNNDESQKKDDKLISNDQNNTNDYLIQEQKLIDENSIKDTEKSNVKMSFKEYVDNVKEDQTSQKRTKKENKESIEENNHIFNNLDNPKVRKCYKTNLNNYEDNPDRRRNYTVTVSVFISVEKNAPTYTDENKLGGKVVYEFANIFKEDISLVSFEIVKSEDTGVIVVKLTLKTNDKNWSEKALAKFSENLDEQIGKNIGLPVKKVIIQNPEKQVDDLKIAANSKRKKYQNKEFKY
jgi:hypothetical protein